MQPGDVGRRHLVMWIARQLGASNPHIAYYMGFECHTTVWHGISAAERRRAADEAYRDLTDRLLTAARVQKSGISVAPAENAVKPLQYRTMPGTHRSYAS
jgi:hypothetical protein